MNEKQIAAGNGENKNFQLAESFVNYTGRSIFLTGKAGTGKTTFLHHIVKTTAKNLAVAAPTGVAAINAGGVTLHSLFQLPFGPYIPEGLGNDLAEASTKSTLLSKVRFNSSKRKLIREMELLIIDEISMVRADMMDAIDVILKHIRKSIEPFGGLQVLMIGDLFQLPPVISNQDWQILGKFYRSPYFFNAKVLSDEKPIGIELKKIYRQADFQFIDLLNNVRMANTSESDLISLNERFDPGFEPQTGEQFIVLSTHNDKARSINQDRLKQLPGKSYQFKAVIEGEFQENAFPVAENLELKEGAQVIFTKNDKEEPRRYYNGKIGTISNVTSDHIMVLFPNEEIEIKVEQEEWLNIRYSLNEEKNEIEEVELGSFRQYPLKLAWAITIHKSQGLTFPKAIVDAGESFSTGQVYVALSRLTSLEGLVLKSKITAQSIKTDPLISSFSDQLIPESDLPTILEKERQIYIKRVLLQAFNWERMLEAIQQLEDYLFTSKIPMKEAARQLSKQWMQEINEQKRVGNNFVRQVLEIFQMEDFKRLQERTQKAVPYFTQHLQENVIQPLERHQQEIKGKKNVKTYTKHLQLFHLKLNTKKEQLQQASLLAGGLANGAQSQEILRSVDQYKKESKERINVMVEANQQHRKEKGESQRLTLSMFKEGKTVLEIATERDYAFSTIEGHLIGFVKSGELELNELVEEQKIKDIKAAISKLDTQSVSVVKQAMSDDYTFGEIRAVFTHLNSNH